MLNVKTISLLLGGNNIIYKNYPRNSKPTRKEGVRVKYLQFVLKNCVYAMPTFVLAQALAWWHGTLFTSEEFSR